MPPIIGSQKDNMAKNLVVVESPAKAKTIEKYLGKDFVVLASYGHVRDLVPKEGAVDPDDKFAMRYQVIDRNKKHVDAIARELKKADTLYLATDPDREGEAISWHLLELLTERKLIKDKDVFRVVFHEITKKAIRGAIADPRGMAMDLVNAQQARRALDYLVGFNLSPLLWRKVNPGLSAGRVQSPALRMIVEREAEIEQFIPREYWTIEADVKSAKKGFVGKLAEFQGEKIKQFTITDEARATEVQKAMLNAANGKLDVTKVEKKQRKRNPAAPFITSTLQQEASRKLGFSAQRTMRAAQQLYEGADIGGETTGLITYMRTDSVALAAEAVEEIRGVIADRYGAENLPEEPRVYKTSARNAQEAHEAIRPTSSALAPENVASHLTEDQLKLYTLIWKRTVACQMVHATYNTVAMNLSCSEGHFRATGSTLLNAGFMAVYQEGQDDSKADDDEDKILPPLEVGDVVNLEAIRPDQHFTEPPPRFTEASLVKALEEHSIGRPSTYASIISTLVDRDYVELESRRFTPTDIGKIVGKFLSDHFTNYVDYNFTANLEDQLDEISRGEKEWVPILSEFWGPFKEQCDEKANISREEVAQARQLGDDPATGKPVSVRIGRYGPFAQIGTKDDEEKPTFAKLMPGQKMSNITLEEALELFKLPRDLGETPEGEKLSTNFGRFGPYVKYGSKFVSIPKEEEADPYTITPERAMELVAEKKAADLAKIIKQFDDSDIEILNGRWGPYITNGDKNAKIPKDREAASLTLEECEALIEAAPEKKTRRKSTAKKPAAKKATDKKPADKKPAAKKPAAKKPAAKKPATKKAATKTTTTKKPAAKKPAAKKPAAKKPAAKKPTSKKE